MSKSLTPANLLALRAIAAGKLCAPNHHKKLQRDGLVEVVRDTTRCGGKHKTNLTPKGQRELARAYAAMRRDP